MFKNKSSNKLIKGKANPWLFVLVFTTVLVAPAGILTKLLCTELEPFVIATLRAFVTAIVLLPVLIKYFKQHKKVLKKKLKWILLFGALATPASPAYIAAISMTEVSFVAIMDLLTPILFVIISTLATKDKLTRNAFIGILFAMLGGSIILLLPMIFNWSGVSGFGLIPVLLIAVYMLVDAGRPVVLRKLNTGGLSLMPILAIFYCQTLIVSSVLALTVHGPESFTAVTTLPSWGWAIILFQALFFSVAVSWLNTKAYENLGTATTASINYLYYALAIALPLILLGEKLPLEVIIGGTFVIIGIIFVRRHPHKHVHHTRGHV
ncbi:DMT family transporter [Candidatus Saccharibacteria bacterium]|nr:DMT family transporter [Candidatus Saccharibacteria bacterium]